MSQNEVTAAAPRGIGPIEEPTPNDVLCGRGKRSNKHEGNVKMRQLALQVLPKYLDQRSDIEKLVIADSIVHKIKQMGGRFLKQDSDKKWCDIGDEMARKKVAQVIRECKRQSRVKRKTTLETEIPLVLPAESDAFNFGINRGMNASQMQGTTVNQHHTFQSMIDSEIASGIYMFQFTNMGDELPDEKHRNTENVFAGVAAHAGNSQSTATSPILISEEDESHTFEDGQENLEGLLGNDAEVTAHSDHGQSTSTSPIPFSELDETHTSQELSIDNDHSGSDVLANEKDAPAEFVLSIIEQSFTGPKISEEEWLREQQQMAEEERMAALSDMFGDLCDISQPRKKRFCDADNLDKKEPIPSTIQSYVQKMRFSVAAIPLNQKQALVEAWQQCSPAEFSEERLDLFLHREDMIPEKAAQRFIRYWEKRREIFGLDKYFLPMTLNGALRDDLVALKTGLHCILPDPDVSGRHVLFTETRRDTRDGYTRDSLVRACWYIFEAIAQMPNVKKGIVVLHSGKGMTLLDYDRDLHPILTDIERHCMPFKPCAIHVAFVPTILRLLINPLGCWYLGKYLRTRMVFHSSEGDDLLQDLSSYGMGKAMLPGELGGTLQYNHLEWLEQRKANGL